LTLTIAHRCVAFRVRGAGAVWSRGAGDRAARCVFGFCEAAEEVERIGLRALRGGDRGVGVGDAVDGGGDDGFAGGGVEDGELGLGDGVVGGTVVEVDGAREHSSAGFELFGVVEY
jgi:hypothetical protein